jgi:hypothetical protein
MCRRSARSLGRYSRPEYRLEAHGIVRGKDGSNAQRSAQNIQGKRLYSISVVKALSKSPHIIHNLILYP